MLTAIPSNAAPNTLKLPSNYRDSSSTRVSITFPCSNTLSVDWFIYCSILSSGWFRSRVRSLDPNKEWLCNNSSAVALSLGFTRSAWHSQVRSDAYWSPGKGWLMEGEGRGKDREGERGRGWVGEGRVRGKGGKKRGDREGKWGRQGERKE